MIKILIKIGLLKLTPKRISKLGSSKDIKMLEYAMEKGNYSFRKQVVIELGEIKEDD